MEQQLQKLKEALAGYDLRAEIDYGVDYDLPDADTIIVTDEYDDIVAEGETADEILKQLKHRLK